MSLSEIEKDLQERDSKVINRPHDTTVYDVWQSKEETVEEKPWQKYGEKEVVKKTRKKAIVISGIFIGVLCVVLLLVAFFVYFQYGFFSQERVSLMMEAPQIIDSNKITEITFVYNNDNRAQLLNAEILVQFGDYFVPTKEQDHFERTSDNQGIISIGDIDGHESGKFVLAGYFTGPTDAVNAIAGSLRYAPEKTNAQYTTDARAATTMSSSPIVIDVEAPSEIVSGNLMNIVFKIRNTSNEEVSKLKFVVDMPKAFSINNAFPSPNYGNVWIIDKIPAKGEAIVNVRGGLNVVGGSVYAFEMRVLAQDTSSESVEYAKANYAPRVTQSPFVIQQSIKENKSVVYAGDQLTYTLQYINNSSVTLRDVIVTLNLEGNALDYQLLELGNGGDYDQTNRRITWKASDVPALKLVEPNASGEIYFSVPVLKNLPISSEKDFNFAISSIATIDSESIPSELRENKSVLSNVLTIPVGAKVVFNKNLTYSAGSQALKVGEKTIYTVSMKIDSINNDIGGVSVLIPLPTQIKFESLNKEGLIFNERTNELTWNVGDVPHGTGVTKESRTMTFDVSVVPSINQIGVPLKILNTQKMSGVDQFTKTKFEISSDSIDSSNGDQELQNTSVK